MKTRILLMAFVLTLSVLAVGNKMAHAEEDAAGVAGCAGIAVDPAASLEFQQNICNAGENDAATSCGGAEGHGTCSSPKLNDTLPEANHCICVGEATEAAPTSDSAPAE